MYGVKATFVYSVLTSFVKKDIEILNNMNVSLHQIRSHPHKDFFNFSRNRFIELLKSILFIPKSQIVICWFCDYHGLIPLLLSRIFKKKFVVIVGGYDAVSYKELNYGVFQKRNLRRRIACWIYNHATEIWVVHKSLKYGCKNSKNMLNIDSGIKIFLKNINTEIKEVATGYDFSFWKPTKNRRNKNTILTVANIDNFRTFKRKGLPQFIELARSLHDFKFTIVGLSKKMILDIEKPKNITLIGKVNSNKLIELYSENFFYYQGSIIEGLPNVLCEAMLCECVPIGNNVFGISDAIGDTGFIFHGFEELYKVKKFLKSNVYLNGKKARERIKKKYPLYKRVDKFKSLFGGEKV